jgi:hypothetical protein
MDYGARADALGNWFLDRPMDVTMEADMQCRLVEMLRREFEVSDDLIARCPNPSLIDDGNFAQYKRPYIERIAERSSDKEPRLSRVHPEVNLSGPGAPNEQIDVVVFDRELDYPIRWNGGSKRYDERDVAAAFELKFITNQNVISNDFDTQTLRRASEDEMRSRSRIEQLDTQNRKLDSDLSRLNDLPTDETYLILFSHYNYLFQPELLDGAGATKRKNRKVGWTVDAWLSRETKRGSTDILYAHPGGKTWWR